MKIGVMFGSPEVVGVGKALKFFASIRLDIRRSPPIEEDKVAIGHNMKFNVVKNKTAPPFKRAEVRFLYGIGYDRPSEILSLAVQMEIIKLSGSHYSYQEMKLGQGKAKVFELFEGTPELYEEIEAAVIEGLKQQ